MNSIFFIPLSSWTGSIANAVSPVLLGCSRMSETSVVLVERASASTSICSGTTDASVRVVRVELARSSPANSVNERRDRIWSFSFRSTRCVGLMFSLSPYMSE